MRTCVFLVALSCFVACKSKSSTEPTTVGGSASAAPSAEAPAVARPATAVVATRADVKSFVADAGNVYWLSGGYTGAPKGLLVAPKAGGTPKKLAEVNQRNGLWVTGANVYFMDGPEIFLVGKTGGTPATFAKGEMLGPAAAGGDTFCWMAGSAPKLEDAPAGGVPQKTITAAGEMTLLCKKDSGKMVARVQKMPMILPGPLLVSGDEVFWTSRRDQTVLASATDGGRQRTVVSDMARVEALATNASTLFLIGMRGSEKGVYAVDRKGGTPKLLAPIDAPVAMDLAADSTNVYYAVKGGLFSVPVAGGTPTALFQDADQEPQGLAVDGSNVFVAIGMYVHRLPKPEPR